jgi:ArsR family transcriptional regulator
MIKKKVCCDCGMIHGTEVEKVRSVMPTDEMFSDLSDLFRIIGDSTRTKILWILNEKELCVCDIATLLCMTKSAVSHQLKVLKDYNLVKSRRDGKIVYYSIADNHVQKIFETAVEHLNE